jgi:hypothetical protein
LIDADQLKIILEKILKSYNLLSETTHFDKSRENRAEDGLWQVVISANVQSLKIISRLRIILIPKGYSRTLDQLKPTGTLPLIDHEITHVLQHENISKLNIEVLKCSDGNARTWFETGATGEENLSYETYFGINRGNNLHYLRAMQKQLDGGNISECTRVFLNSLLRSAETVDQDTAIETAVDRTLRLFKNGMQWSPGSGYLTNTQPLEYAELQILRRTLPTNLHWLFFVGANFQTLAELYRVGWLKKEDVFVPEKMPSSIALDYLTSNKLN